MAGLKYLALWLAFSAVAGRNPKTCPEELAHPTHGTLEVRADDPTALRESVDSVASMGQAVSIYDPKLKTRIYHAVSAPNTNGDIPLVQSDARAVIVYLHGCGTKKAGGKNFLNKMQPLINAGLSPVSLDLPFHGEGPTDGQHYELDYFMHWFNQFIDKLAAYGKPIYLVGHSFGPFVIQEYCSRYPSKIKGALLISASGDYHPALKYTYEKITLPGMHFIDENLKEYEGNPLGGFFAGNVMSAAKWMGKAAPATNMVFLRGTNDEWFPENKWLPARMGLRQPYGPRVVEAWLAKQYPDAKFIFAEGVGHYIFDATHANGRNLILQLMYDLTETPEALQNAAARELDARTVVAQTYYIEPLFRQWLGARYRHAIFTPERAEMTLKDWQLERDRRWWKMFEKIPTVAPEFFAQRQISWETLNTKYPPETRGKNMTWKDEVTSFQTEYARWADAKTQGKNLDLGPDRLKPPPAQVDAKLFVSGEVYKHGIVGPIQRAVVEESVAKGGGTVTNVEISADKKLAKLTYTVPRFEKPFSIVALNALERDEITAFLQEAFYDALQKNGWRPLEKMWTGEARGIRMRGTQQERRILTVELLWGIP